MLRPTIRPAGFAGPALPVLTYSTVRSAPVLGPAAPSGRLVGLAVVGFLYISGAGAAWAQGAGDRPSEQDIFGGGNAAPAAPSAPAPAPPAPGSAPAPSEPAPSKPAEGPPTSAAPPAAAAAGTDRDQALLGNASGPTQPLSDYIAPENPLTIGGQVYLRAQSTASAHQQPDAWSFDAPSLLDAYFDARPNPRVRAFVLGRMSYDPTLPPNNPVPTQVSSGMSSGGALVGGNPTGFSTFSNTRGPNTILDQMWIRFDIENTVFVTAGKQHVRWGTGRFWQPTDYLHPIKRNPLDVFDARPGTSMLKLHVPWEERGWNFYGFAVTEDPNAGTQTLRRVAGAFRAELVLLGVEIGLDTFLERDQNPKVGFDLSTGIWDFDVYADVGFQPGSNFVHYFPEVPTISGFTGYETQAVGGINYSRKYNDNDMWTAGIEYFYNHPGYTSADLYPQAINFALDHPSQVSNPFALLPFFYLGRQYGAAFVSFPAPYSWNYTTFTLSTIGNLSDKSFVTRLDYSVTILTHLSVEAFGGVHYGHVGGEFRLQLPNDVAARLAGLFGSTPTTLTSYPIVDLGVALRLKI
jgi:hypothetical protein